MLIVSTLLVLTQLKLKACVVNFKEGVNLNTIISFILDINLWIAIGSTGIAAVVWLYVLSYEKLSVAYPLISFSYILMIFAASYFYGEKITASQIIGTVFVFIGVYFLFRK